MNLFIKILLISCPNAMDARQFINKRSHEEILFGSIKNVLSYFVDDAIPFALVWSVFENIN